MSFEKFIHTKSNRYVTLVFINELDDSVYGGNAINFHKVISHGSGNKMKKFFFTFRLNVKGIVYPTEFIFCMCFCHLSAGIIISLCDPLLALFFC